MKIFTTAILLVTIIAIGGCKPPQQTKSFVDESLQDQAPVTELSMQDQYEEQVFEGVDTPRTVPVFAGEIAMNLDADESPTATVLAFVYSDTGQWVVDIEKPEFDPHDAITFNRRIDLQFVDDLGGRHSLSLYLRRHIFDKAIATHRWQLYAFVDEELVSTVSPHTAVVNPDDFSTLHFDYSGLLKGLSFGETFDESGVIQLSLLNDEGQSYLINLDLSASTQYAAEFVLYTASGDPGPLGAPSASTFVHLAANLDADVTLIDPETLFSKSRSESYHHVIATAVYDSLGNAREFQVYFRRVDFHQWSVFVFLDGRSLMPVSVLEGDSFLLQFDKNGELNSAGSEGEMSVHFKEIDLEKGASPLTLSLNLHGMRQYGADFQIYNVDSNGHPSLRGE